MSEAPRAAEIMRELAGRLDLQPRAAAIMTRFPELVERDPTEGLNVLALLLVAATATDKDAKRALAEGAMAVLDHEPEGDARCKECQRILPVARSRVRSIDCGVTHEVVFHDGSTASI